MPAALIILVLVFGSLVAGLVPVAMGLVSIQVGLGIVALLSLAFSLSVFIVNMLTGMGLALGIDYSLFIVSRYREERARGRTELDSIARGGARANRAVEGGSAAARDAALLRLQERLAHDPRFGPGVMLASRSEEVTLLSVPVRGDPSSRPAAAAVLTCAALCSRLRSPAPAHAPTSAVTRPRTPTTTTP